MLTIGLPEYLFAAVVGLVVGVGMGMRRSFDSKKLIAMVINSGFWCAFVGGVAMFAFDKIYYLNFDTESSDQLILLAIFTGAAFAMIVGTPIALTLWWLISKFRRRNIQGE